MAVISRKFKKVLWIQCPVFWTVMAIFDTFLWFWLLVYGPMLFAWNLRSGPIV
jgi:hypothetical protein